MEAVISINPGASKWDIRQKVWDYIEANDLANFPRPVHNRIPNFKGAAQACDQLTVLQEFKSSSVVKVNPDKPQEQARYCTLEGAHGACNKVSELEVFSRTDEVKVDPDKPLEGARLLVLEAKKTLLVPTPRLRTGLFNKIVPPQGASKEDLRVCATSQGVKDFSVPIGLDAKVKVDLVVVGSVAVSEKGYRIGKGEGYADMEYGMMVAMGAVSESTVVVTVVHDCQVVDIPEELIESHDLTVDYILTPTRVIQTGCTRAKPPGIIWSKVDADMLAKIPILKKLRALEQEAGKDVTLKPRPEGEARPDKPDRPRREGTRGPRREPKGQSRRAEHQGEPQEAEGHDGAEHRAAGQSSVTTVYLGNIPAGVRVSELKGALREREAAPLRLTWQGAQHRAFLDYASQQAAEAALSALQDLSIHGHTLQPEMAKSQRGDRSSRPPGQTRRRRPKPPANTAAPAAEAAPDNTNTTPTTTTSSTTGPAKPRARRPNPKGKVKNQPPPSP